MEIVENRMVIDSEWQYVEPVTVEPEKPESGFKNVWTLEFVSADDALDYAREHEEQGDMTDEEFVEWFFSDNWIRRD